MVSPGEVAGNVGAQKPEGGDSFHAFSIYEEESVALPVLPEVHNKLFYFMDIQGCLLSNRSLSTSALYAVLSPSEMSPTTVVSSAYLMMALAGWVGVVIGKQGIQ